MDPALDRLHCATRPLSGLKDWPATYNLVEIWWWKHPGRKEYSCYSDSHFPKSFSRLDMFFVTSDLLTGLKSVSYLPRAIADHSPLELELQVSKPMPLEVWSMSPYWLMEPMVLCTFMDDISHYWTENTQGVSDSVRWDTFKAVMRGAYIIGVTALKKSNSAKIDELADELGIAGRSYIN